MTPQVAPPHLPGAGQNYLGISKDQLISTKRTCPFSHLNDSDTRDPNLILKAMKVLFLEHISSEKRMKDWAPDHRD